MLSTFTQKTLSSEVRLGQSAALCTLLLDTSSKPMHANLQRLKAGAEEVQGSGTRQGAAAQSCKCCTCRWGQGAGGRRAQTGRDRSRSEGAGKKGTRAPTPRHVF